ncbi:MAG: hypothetical protein JWP06_750 [Candidatus Saccharibacteria bacterium]|nr:hypothetical protein [Candidatus Saccharibacteria bacterium]
MQRTRKQIKRIATAIVGGVVIIVGIIAIPYPGPGWLIVFAGLAILATEFTWAERVLDYARHKYDMWTEWSKRQHVAVRFLILALTGAIVLATLWLLNMFGIFDTVLQLHMSWLHSPLGIFK